jgi:hypothetical protein
MKIILLNILISIFFSFNALSETLILGVERDWTAYRSDSGDKRTCFVSSEPKSSKGDYKKENRGDVRVYVTHGPAQDVTNEVSIKAGYDHKEQSIVKYTIDGKKFSLFTLKDRAWAETPELDSKIVSAMKAGNKLLVSGCGVMGERAYIGSGKFSRLMSLPVDKADARDQKVWRIEEDSQFPEPYKRTNNERCLSPQQWDSNQQAKRYDLMPGYRQNFGTVTTSEGMWMIGGLIAPSADLSGRLLNRKYNVEGCTKQAHLNDVWVFNPRGWTRETVLGDAINNAENQGPAESVLPTRRGYSLTSNVQSDQNQTFADFRLSDTPGPNGITIAKAIEDGWECTGVQGKWCRKPFLPRQTKGAESVIMCFEPAAGTESVNAFRQGDTRQIKKRPRPCTVDETNDPNNNCICYIVNVSGQSGLKQSPGGSGFRPEIDYLEIRRADGTWGSDKPIYETELNEFCPDAVESYPGFDPVYVNGAESATSDYLGCTSDCHLPGQPGQPGQQECNRSWQKRNLRREWHEAGRIKHPRMGFLAGTVSSQLFILFVHFLLQTTPN